MAEHLTGAQMNAVEAKIRKELSAIIEQMHLRKEAMRMALESKASDPVGLADEIYIFLTRPLANIVLTDEVP